MHPRLRVLADYLLKCGGAADVNPREIDAKALPHLFILNIERDADRKLSGLRIRFTGTALDKVFERKLIDRRLEEFVHGPRASDVLAAFHASADTGQALWMRQVVHMQDRPPRFVEGVTIRISPDRLYGGVVVGELATSEGSGFESQPLN
jgi:hypothetical protein